MPQVIEERIQTAHKLLEKSGPDVVQSMVQKLCRKSFLVFQKVELGMEIGPHHVEWWEELETGEDCIFLSPRDHGKSMSIARAYPIWKAKYDPWVREVLMLGADLRSSTENLEKLKEMLMSVKSLHYLIPQDRKAYFNSKTEVKLSNGVVIRAMGFFSPLRGRHPQLIVMDDVLNERNTATQLWREKSRKRLFEVVLPMKDQGIESKRLLGYKPQLVISGTAQERDDFYQELLDSPHFKGKKQKAIINEETKVVLWPERYPYPELKKRREIIGSLSFSKEYQNEPLSEEASIFPPSLFEPLKDRNLSYETTYQGNNDVYMGVDFSVPGAHKDWMSCCVLELNHKLALYTPLAYSRSQPSTIEEQFSIVDDYARRYKVIMGFLEDNMFQKIYSEHFKNKSVLPLKGHTVTHSGKMSFETGLLSFRPLFENGRFRFPYKTDRDKMMTDHLIKEFNGIVKIKGRIGNEGFHDDVVMAMWHALCASRQSSFSYDMGE